MITWTVADNGNGLPAEIKPSYGIAGMSERVWATGGEMTLTNRPGGGVDARRVGSGRAQDVPHAEEASPRSRQLRCLPEQRIAIVVRKFGSAFLNL